MIDIGPFRGGDKSAQKAVASAFDHACRDIGFLAISGHGIAPDLVRRTCDVAAEFFALPLEQKLAVQRPSNKVSRGYNPLGDQALAYSLGQTTPPDLQESFSIGPLDVPDEPYFTNETARPYFWPNLWPKRPGQFRGTFSDYYRAHGGIGEEPNANRGHGVGSGRRILRR